MDKLRYLELKARYKVCLKHGDTVNINGHKYRLEAADNSGNSPHLGFLWAKELEKQQENLKPVSTEGDVLLGQLVNEGAGKIVGVVSIFDGRFYTFEEYKNAIPSVPNLAAVIHLYEQQCLVELTVLDILKKLLTKLFKRSKVV